MPLGGQEVDQGRVIKALALQGMWAGLRLLHLSRLGYLRSLQRGLAHLGGVRSLHRLGLLLTVSPEYNAVKTGLDLSVQEVVEVVSEEKVEEGQKEGEEKVIEDQSKPKEKEEPPKEELEAEQPIDSKETKEAKEAREAKEAKEA